MITAVALLAALGAGFLVAALTGGLMVVMGPRDRPDGAHKAHAAVTPSGGGLAILAGALAVLVLTWMAGQPLDHPAVGPVLLAVVAVGTLGLLDDIHVVATRLKLVLLAVAAAILVTVGGLQAGLGFVGLTGPVPPGGLWWGLAAAGGWLWVMVTVNTVNFQDGANGVAIGSALVGLCSLAGLGLAAGAAGDLVVLALALAAGCGGFLIWNSPSGRLFAGDTGALAVGMGLASIGLALTQAGVNALLVALCLLPMLGDVILTVVWRVRHDGGPRVLLRPHRHHLYQWLIRCGRTHAAVARQWWGLSAVCGLAACALQLGTRGADPGPAAGVVAGVFGAAAALFAFRARQIRQRCVPPDLRPAGAPPPAARPGPPAGDRAATGEAP